MKQLGDYYFSDSVSNVGQVRANQELVTCLTCGPSGCD